MGTISGEAVMRSLIGGVVLIIINCGLYALAQNVTDVQR
jgi:hypothetical protein